MRRVLRPGILLTASVMSIATSPKEEPEMTHNPPPPPQSVKWTMPQGPFTPGARLNITDEKNRNIYTNGMRCWVEVPFETPPASVMPLPTMDVECPAPLTTDPAWAQCTGQLTLRDAGCECFVMGNPPPPPTMVDCPQIPGLVSTKPMGTGG